MNRNSTTYFFFLFFIALHISVYAQSPLQLSLDDSIKMALENNENIEIAKQIKESAKWQLSSAKKAKGVSISWQTNLSRITSEIYNTNFGNTLSMQYPISTGRRIEETINQQRLQFDSADISLKNEEQIIRFAVIEAYYNVLQKKNLVTIAESGVRMSSEQLSVIQTQYEEGALVKSDLLHMEIELANYKQNLVDANGALEIAENQLLSLIGMPDDTEFETTDKFDYTPYPMTLKECLEFAKANRLDSKIAKNAVKQTETQIKILKADEKPSISAIANKSITDNNATHFNRNESWEAGVVMTWKIFNNNATKESVKAVEADVKKAKAEVDGIDKKIVLQTKSAYIQMKTAEKNIETSAEAVLKAKENLSIAQARYEEGVDILLNLTDAQEKLIRAGTNYYTALYEYNLGRASLEKAMGK
jgi:outer membrane protein TolC